MKLPINIFKIFALSRLKVFYQIQIIVIVMIVFLVIQGFSSVNIINTMQQTTYISFVNSNNLLNNVHNIRLLLEQAKNNYLSILLGSQGNSTTIIPLDLESTIELFGDINQAAVNSLLDRISIIETISRSPAKLENLEEIQKQLDGCFNDTTIIQKSVMDLCQKTFTRNTEFSNTSKSDTLKILIISGMIAFLIGAVISISITRPLQRILVTTRNLALGDLTQTIEKKGCPEAAGAIEGLNTAFVSLRNLVKRINEQSEVLHRASNELKNASIDTGQSAAQVALAMEQLAAGSAEQTNQITQAFDRIYQLSELVTKVSAGNRTIASASEKVTESAKLGQQTTEDVVRVMNKIFESTNRTAIVIEDLNKASEQISEISSTIQEIAERTSLLALNASIEAARAGEQGKGFAVVAQETGILAVQSREAGKRIVDIINQMSKEIFGSISVILQGLEEAKSGKELVSKSNVTFAEIFDLLMTNLAQIDEVAKSAQQMAERNQEVVEAISTIASISEESMASTEEVSATAEEQSAAVEEVSALAENLAEIAGNLRESVITFKIDG